MPCLPLDYLNGWLFGISSASVKEDIRDRVIRYQKECYQVLRDAFQMPVPSSHPLAEIRAMGLAIAHLAEEQMEFERKTEGRFASLDERVVALEDRVAPGQPVTEEQAMQISQAVKTVAMKLSKQTGRNEYGAVYGELYRRFDVTSYKLIPAARFEEAMKFLTEWHGSLQEDGPPF